MTDPCLDLTIPHVGQWYGCKSISVTNSQVVAGMTNSISVTLASNSGAPGHANLYVGTPGTGSNPCVANPPATALDVNNTGFNLLPSITVPTGGTAPDNGSFTAGTSWPNPVMIIAKAVLDQASSCQAAGQAAGWDATSPLIAAHRFAVVTEQMLRSNLFVLLPPEAKEEQQSAFAMSLTAGWGKDGRGRRARTLLRAVVIGTEKREKHLDPRARDLILDYESKEKRGVGRVWTPAPKVRLALGKETLFLEGPNAHPASLGNLGPISPPTMRQLTSGSSGSDWHSERDIQIELALEAGEVRQALIEIPVPPVGAHHVVRLVHQDLDSKEILQERTFIVEPDFGELHEAPHRAA
jgi:hypothetical protein